MPTNKPNKKTVRNLERAIVNDLLAAREVAGFAIPIDHAEIRRRIKLEYPTFLGLDRYDETRRSVIRQIVTVASEDEKERVHELACKAYKVAFHNCGLEAPAPGAAEGKSSRIRSAFMEALHEAGEIGDGLSKLLQSKQEEIQYLKSLNKGAMEECQRLFSSQKRYWDALVAVAHLVGPSAFVDPKTQQEDNASVESILTGVALLCEARRRLDVEFRQHFRQGVACGQRNNHVDNPG